MSEELQQKLRNQLWTVADIFPLNVFATVHSWLRSFC